MPSLWFTPTDPRNTAGVRALLVAVYERWINENGFADYVGDAMDLALEDSSTLLIHQRKFLNAYIKLWEAMEDGDY